MVALEPMASAVQDLRSSATCGNYGHPVASTSKNRSCNARFMVASSKVNTLLQHYNIEVFENYAERRENTSVCNLPKSWY